MSEPVVTREQALVLVQHAVLVQGGFSTPEEETRRCLKDAEGRDDPQYWIDEVVERFRAEVAAAMKAAAPEGGQTSPEDIEAARHVNLLRHLQDLRRIAEQEKHLKRLKESLTAEAVALLGGESLMFIDPTDGSKKIANVRQAESIVVDAGELFEALIEQYKDDVDDAEAVWRGVLKPPVVDTAAEGLFMKATQERTDENLPALISPETVAKVATLKRAAAFVGFAKPGG